MDQNLSEIAAVLEEIAQFVRRPGTDVYWSRYSTVDEALADINQHITRLKRGDGTRLYDVSVLFAPAGSFQDFSIHNGWGEEFIELSARFDEALKKLPEKPQRS